MPAQVDGDVVGAGDEASPVGQERSSVSTRLRVTGTPQVTVEARVDVAGADRPFGTSMCAAAPGAGCSARIASGPELAAELLAEWMPVGTEVGRCTPTRDRRPRRLMQSTSMTHGDAPQTGRSKSAHRFVGNTQTLQSWRGLSR